MIDSLARLDPRVLIVGIGIVALLLALPLELAAFRRLRRLQIARGTMFFLSGGFVIAIAAGIALIAMNLYTYARLTHEQAAARVSIRQLGERQYVLTVETRKAPPRHFQVHGDEWQVDARVLKWRALGNLLGFDTVYRFERLSGRYADIAQERGAARTVHSLAEDPGLDLWSLVRKHHQYVPLADALYGSAVYVPMAEGAEYTVTVSTSGLVVRPGNEAARKAVGGWK
ncbi:MAG TPA: hypothetical protein VHI32_04315 [Burkholderiales bacterium]|jgi:hypothetical protein|nr:hypothetical protein [Burkholderiales bacterium]